MRFNIKRYGGSYLELSVKEGDETLTSGLIEKHELADIVLQFMEAADRYLPQQIFKDIIESFMEER